MDRITFSGRIPKPAVLPVGMKGEHNATTLHMTGLPQFDENQETLLNIVLPDGTADVIQITDGEATLTRNHTPQPGTSTAWVSVQVGEQLVWKSEPMHLLIGPLPDISDPIEQQYPTAFEQIIEDVTELKEAAETAKEGADDAQEAAELAQGKAEDAQDAAEAARDVILGMTATAETLEPGSPATVDYHEGVMAFGIPRGADGQDGQDGFSPTATVTKSGDTVTITITDKSGTTTAEVTSPQIDVATEAETREIIDEYGEDDDDMLFESVYTETSGFIGFVTVDDASDIAAAFKAGKGVTVHLPMGEGADAYGVNSDMYLRMVAFQEGYTLDGYTEPASYRFVTNGIYSWGGEGFSYISFANESQDGKLQFGLVNPD